MSDNDNSNEESEEDSQEESEEDSEQDSQDSQESSQEENNDSEVNKVSNNFELNVSKNPFSNFNHKFTDDIKSKSNDIKLYGNEQLVTLIKDTVKDNKMLIVRGSIGTGKATFIKTVLKTCSYDVTIYDEEITEEIFKEIKKTLRMKFTGIEMMFGLNKQSILIKHYDNMKADYYKDLLKLKSNVPIFLTTTNLNKSFRIPSKVPCYVFKSPTRDNLLSIAVDMYKEPINEQIKLFAEECVGDIRHFLTNFKFNNVKNDIKSDAKSDIKKLSIKDIDYDIRTFFKKINGFTVSEALKLSSIHSNAVTQENYIKFFIKSKKTNLDELHEIADMIAYGDVEYNYLSTNSLWDTSIHELNQLFGTVGPMRHFNCSYETVTYCPNYKNEATIKFDMLEQIAYSMVYIVKDHEKYIEYLIKNYDFNERCINIICKLEKSLQPTILKKILKNLQKEN